MHNIANINIWFIKGNFCEFILNFLKIIEIIIFFTKQKQTQISKTNLWLPNRKLRGRGKLGLWD